MSAGIALTLPGVSVESMPFGQTGWRRGLHTGMAHTLWSMLSGLAAPQIERAMARGDRQRLALLARRWRGVYRRFDTVPAAAMNQLTFGLSQFTVSRDLCRFTWMHEPGARRDAALVYIPGGSFVVDRSPKLTALIVRMARQIRLPLLLCDYRLAPEHPCPAAIDDAVAALRHAMEHGADPSSIAVVAESAGCAVALAAIQRLAREGIRLGAVGFLSPWVDLGLPHGGVTRLTRLTAALYLGGRPADDPEASSIHGPLEGLPPMTIHGSRLDPLFQDGRRLAEAAARAGTRVTMRVWPGGEHVSERYFEKDGLASMAELGAFFSAHLPARAEAA